MKTIKSVEGELTLVKGENLKLNDGGSFRLPKPEDIKGVKSMSVSYDDGSSEQIDNVTDAKIIVSQFYDILHKESSTQALVNSAFKLLRQAAEENPQIAVVAIVLEQCDEYLNQAQIVSAKGLDLIDSVARMLLNTVNNDIIALRFTEAIAKKIAELSLISMMER